MSDDNQTPRGAGIKWSRTVLAVSLALNLAVAGAVVGAFVRHLGAEGRDVRAERMSHDGFRDARVQGFRDRDVGLAPFLDAVAGDDRRDLARAFMQSAGDRGAARARVRAHFEAVVAALQAEPFDPARFEALLAERRADLAARQEVGAQLLAEHVAAMTARERADYAARIEAILSRPPRRN